MKVVRNLLILLGVLLASVAARVEALPDPNVFGVASEPVLQSSILTNENYISLAGYYLNGDGGGGQLYQVQAANCLTVEPQGTWSAPSFTINVTSTAGIIPGMRINATGIPAGDYVVAVNSPNITLAIELTAPGSSTQLYIGGNGGTLFIDGEQPMPPALPACFQRSGTTGSVVEWGAQCNVQQSGTPGVIAAGMSTFVAPNDFYNSLSAGEPIVITGAGPSGGTLATTVNGTATSLNQPPTPGMVNGTNTVTISPSGIFAGMKVIENDTNNFIPNGTIVTATGVSSITISQAATGTGSVTLSFKGTSIPLAITASTAVPTWVAVNPTVDDSNGGSNYTTGDQITLTDGTVLEVMPGVSLQPLMGSNANVLTQTAEPFIPPMPLSQSSGTGGTGAEFDVQMTPTGQFAYGTDDSVAINAALASALQNSDIWLPANRACGVGYTSGVMNDGPILLPNGNTSLRGWDMGSSGLVALAQMPGGSSSFVVERPNGAAGGGGMRDLYVEANKLASYACAIEGGEKQFYGNVACNDAVTSEWICGNAATQINGTIFDHIRGESIFGNFGHVADMSVNDYLATGTCEGEEVNNSYFAGAQTPLYDSQKDFNLYLGDILGDIQPFNPTYCAQLGGKQTFIGGRCLNASNNVNGNATAAVVYLTGNHATVGSTLAQWDNAVPTATTYGVLVAPSYAGGLIEGVNTNGSLPAANVVYQQGTVDPSTIVVNNAGASLVVPGPGYGVPNPQGRLTLHSGSPVMTGNFSGVPTIYYDCYTGQNVPYFNGGTDSMDAIAACGVSASLIATGTGQELANDIFDVWWWHNAGSPVLCVATNGSGKGWSGDGGSLSSRGSGYTQLSATARGYLTNNNAFTMMIGAHCYNLVGSMTVVDYVAAAPGGIIPANSLTYLGSFYTTANGQTSFVPQPTPASGGANALVGIWNGYNRVPVAAVEQDTASAYSVSTSSWEVADAHNSGKNNIEVVDGAQQTAFDLLLTQVVNNNSGSSAAMNPKLSINLANTCTTATPLTFTSQQSTSPISVAYNLSSPPLPGFQCAQAMEMGTTGFTGTLFNAGSALTMRLNWQY